MAKKKPPSVVIKPEARPRDGEAEGRRDQARLTAGPRLLTSEKHLNFFLNKCLAGGWELNLADHTLARTREHDRIFGYDSSPPQWTYEIFLEHVLPEDRAEVDRLFRAATTAQTDWNCACRIRRHDGEVRWIEVSGEHQSEGVGTLVRLAGIVQDITERKETDAALRRAGELQEATSSRSGLEIKAAHDYAEATLVTARDSLVILHADLRVKTANRAFYRTFQTSPAETEGRLIYELGNGQWRIPRLRQLLEEILPRDNFFDDFEIVHDFPVIGLRVMLLNSRRLDAENASQLILLSIEDVTERLESRTAMKCSEMRYRRLFETAQDGILSLDPVTRKITDANPYMTQLLGYTREEFLGRELWQIGLLKDEAASQAAFRELQHRRFIRYEYLPLESKSGQRREVEFVSNLYDEDGQEVIQCNIRDITERKFTENALRDAIDELRRAQQVAERASKAKDGILAALSHELRTPLTPVLMAAAALREDERLPADAREQLGMIERNIALEARLIDELLDVTKIEHGKLELRAQLCDAHLLIDRAIEIVEDDARAKAINFERAFGAARSRLMVDPARFQQVIWNLLRNAVKFTPPGGRVFVRTREEKGAEDETWLRIEVADTGIGIDPARLEQIFQPFDQGGLTGDHRFGGVGLGLAIARAVVELHGGRVTASSAGVNRGATFVVELPGAVGAPSAGSENKLPSSDAGLPAGVVAPAVVPLRLLLVEDHESTLQTLSRLLQRDGHRIITARTVADGLAAATTDTFDLVISDLGLPDGSGTALMERLRDDYGLRGIALSGYGTEQDIARSRDAGFALHLVKPVSIAELRRAIASLPACPAPV